MLTAIKSFLGLHSNVDVIIEYNKLPSSKDRWSAFYELLAGGNVIAAQKAKRAYVSDRTRFVTRR